MTPAIRLGAALAPFLGLAFAIASVGPLVAACSKTPDRVSDPVCNSLDMTCNMACAIDADCASPNRQFICADDGFCKAICRSSADCNVAHDAFDGAPWKGCELGGCTCSDFACLVPDCFTSDECGDGGKVCRAGRCQDADTDFDRCEVYPGFAVLAVGGTRTFTVVAYAGERPVLLADKASWSAASANVSLGATTDETGTRATFVGAGATPAGESAQAVRASIGGVSCSADVEVLAPSGASLRVVLVDEASGRRLSGATVVADMGLGATERVQLEEESGLPGSYALAGTVPTDGLSVSAFHPDFDVVTVAGIHGRDLLIPMRRAAGLGLRKGGVRGAITTIAGAPSSQLAAGFVGLSIQGSLLDLGLDQFLGESVTMDLSIAALVDVADVPLPGGVVIGAKDAYVALGSPGPCADAHTASAGACGQQAAFSLGVSLPMTDLAPLASAITGDGPINYGALLSQALPILAQVELGLVRDVAFDLVPPDDFSTEALPVVDMTPAVALNRRLSLSVPPLPQLAGEAAGVVAGAVLAHVEDRGFVPLGLGAGVDAPSAIPLQVAAPQGGVEGSPFVLVAVALPASGLLADGALGFSGVVATMRRLDGAALPAASGEFLGLPSGGALEVTSGKRALKGIAEVEGAGIYRVLFSLPSGRRWTVTFGGGDVEIPLPAQGFEDLDLAPDAPPFMVQAVRLADDGDIEALFALSGSESPSRLNAMLRAFSIHEAAAPETAAE
ncbi:MAG: hypothetical protein LBM75_04030 [Myxococcales bacterium]|jgi:hypothetical protein|nr:hypothetical protein [Myxococcales bacterium]